MIIREIRTLDEAVRLLHQDIDNAEVILNDVFTTFHKIKIEEKLKSLWEDFNFKRSQYKRVNKDYCENIKRNEKHTYQSGLNYGQKISYRYEIRSLIYKIKLYKSELEKFN